MPFTLAHPAAVLLLLRNKAKYFSATALIAGSMVPDFESFLFMNERKTWGHTWSGLFWFDLPLGLALGLVFQYWVRPGLFPFLPDFFRCRSGRYSGKKMVFGRNFLILALSVLIGAFSHLIWDSITHFDLLHPHGVDSGSYTSISDRNKIPQILSSLAGLFYCWHVLRLLPVGNIPDDWERLTRYRPVYWAVVLVITVAIFSLRLLLARDEPNLVNLVNFSFSGLVYALLIMPGLVQVSSSFSG